MIYYQTQLLGNAHTQTHTHTSTHIYIMIIIIINEYVLDIYI